ncbi:cag pathogenicity island protein Cag25, partial [Pseudoalteromonas sp. S1727]
MKVFAPLCLCCCGLFSFNRFALDVEATFAVL